MPRTFLNQFAFLYESFQPLVGFIFAESKLAANDLASDESVVGEGVAYL